ncbi:MAG: glycine--tRNA ligase subunit beta, partial [Proteobacteria bacterium]|nr:glycine--tRNA ligase subunit beta [Pseudomonadota bacterium]
MSKEDLFFEIGTEELPAGFINPALDQLSTLIEGALKKARLAHGTVATLGTPRRLVLTVEGLSASQSDVSLEVKGPKKAAAYDAQGEPTKALQGFARGQGVELKDIEVRGEGKAEHVYATKHVKGKETAELLPEILTGLIGADLFRKTMRWGSGERAFARPIHWITALFGSNIIDFEYCSVR